MSDLMPTTDDVDTDDSEADSEAPAGPRRGRPRVTPPWYEAFLEESGEAGQFSRRRNVNHYYRQRAYVALDSNWRPVFAWLLDRATKKARSEILVELGRFGDAETIREIAARLCEMKPKTKKAVALVRN